LANVLFTYKQASLLDAKEIAINTLHPGAVLAISTGFIKKDKRNKFLPILIGIIATILSMMMFTIESYMGIWQRLIFTISFAWMIYEFKDKVGKPASGERGSAATEKRSEE
jgi:hypothetical protein